MQIHSVGIDLGKTTFHLVALSAAGKVLLRKKFTQKQLITFTANISQCFQDSYEVGDAPFCVTCGALMVRNGSCHKCANCGGTSGYS